MKSLETVQQIAKVMKILCLIAFIFTIIGVAGFIVGEIILRVYPYLSENIQNLLLSLSEDTYSPYASVNNSINISNIVYLIGQVVVLGFTNKYLKNELADGTPFTYRGAKELLRLGIISIAVPFGAMIISSAIMTLANLRNFSTGFDGTVGIILIVLSFVFKYGADLNHPKVDEEAEKLTEENNEPQE